MTEKTAIKKTRKVNAQSKAVQIRKLVVQGKLTPKQIGEKVGAPLAYVYVVRSKMRAQEREAGLPAVAEKKIPVLGGIQEVASEAELRKAQATQAPILLIPPREERYRFHANPSQFSPEPAPMQITMVEPPTFFERVKNTVRAWLS
jgi:hypothetical protein